MGLLKILLILTILSIPTGEIFRVELTKEIGINLIDILICTTCIYGILYLAVNKIKNIKYGKYFFAFIGIGIVSLLINSKGLTLNQILVSALYPGRFLLLFMIFPLVKMQSDNFKSLVKKIMIFDGLAIVVIGLIQFFLYPSLRDLYYLGWDEHLYRLFSVFLDPNFTGIFIVLFIIFITSFLLTVKKQKTKELIFYGLSVIGSLVALGLTYSREALLSFSLISPVFIFINKRKYVPIVLLVILLTIIFQLKSVRSEGTNILRTASTESRVTSSYLAFSVFKQHPILGIGFDNYRLVLEKNSSSKGLPTNNFPSHGSSAPDNSFLFVLVTTGIIGFTFYLLFWYSIVADQIRERNKLQSQVILASVVVLFISRFFVNALFYTPIMLWFFYLLGIKESK